MNYAWEAVLQAEKHGRQRDSLRFVEAHDPSPYIEVSVMDLNLESPEEDTVGSIRSTGSGMCSAGSLTGT